MNERIIELWEKAQTCVIDTDCSDYHERLQLKFAKLIIKHILLKMESEIALAYEQDQPWTAATLEALALEILDDFDMEIKDDE